MLKNAKTTEAVKSLQKFENYRNRALSDKKRAYEAILKNFNNDPYKYFSSKLDELIYDVLEHLPEDQMGLAYQNEKSINELIRRGVCVCGRPLEEHTQAFEHIMQELRNVPPKSIFAMVETYKKDMRNCEKQINNYSQNIINNYKQYSSNRDSIEEYDESINNIRKRINHSIDTAALQASRDRHLNGYSQKLQEKQKLEDEIKQYESRKQLYSEQINKNSSVTEKSKKLKKYRAYANAVIADINKDYEVKEENFKSRLNELVNKYFKQMYHGTREISIDNNFKMILTANLKNKKIKTEESPGLQTVKNFAFIAALVEIAKESRNSEDNDLEIDPYPLVLDAPFSSADEVHVPNICKLIAEVAEQTIIVVMEKDWNYAKSIMKDKVGKKYVLDKQTETYTVVRSMD
ncbi:hypothetical protein NMU03_00045 [Allocoprobacillus halotolerans]|uniref:DNA sulfur modification protein DndD n=1 Tax=Allocoprobacillus halotolerans TaxID=2944914 RepID=A0ABY5I1L6_9FIRM|nr:hypothetical protein [Allocoprobacillus halotolerans]UTY39266.1 hypothetical protein NMU03_00045 [Allocoprobacillus halotolerans]